MNLFSMQNRYSTTFRLIRRLKCGVFVFVKGVKDVPSLGP